MAKTPFMVSIYLSFFILILFIAMTTWLLSYFLPVYLCILLDLICLWLYIKGIILVLLFPGSTYIFRRGKESSYCREMTAQLLIKIKDIKIFLESLLDSNRNDQSLHLMPFNSSVRSVLMSIMSNMSDLLHSQILSPYQKRLHNSLQQLKSTLENGKLIINSSEEVSVWDWIEASSSRAGSDLISFEDTPEPSLVLKAIQICKELEIILRESCAKTGFFNNIKRWIKDDTLGSLSYMRADLKRKLKAEVLEVKNKNGRQLDCLWIPTQYPDNACMIICSSKYYEYAYLENEWIEFYLRLGVNVMLWNFRGFGRTLGLPGFSSIAEDAEAIVEFIRMNKPHLKLGIHGEGIGGIIAVQVARKLPLDFLLADRLLWQLSIHIYYKIGFLASLLVKLTFNDTPCVASEYLQVPCHKLVTCDFQDSDLSSLKSGIAYSLITSNKPTMIMPRHSPKIGHVLSFHETKNVHSALGRLKKIRDSPLNKDLSSQYRLIRRESEIRQDEDLNHLVSRVGEIIDKIDAGGKPLFEVLRYDSFALTLWIATVDIWGTKNTDNLPLETSSAMKNAASQLSVLMRNHLGSNKLIIKKVCDDIAILVTCLEKICRHIENRFDMHTTHNDSFIASQSGKAAVLRDTIDYLKAGRLIPVHCGHNGHLTQIEKYQYEQHLLGVHFINS